MTADVRTTMARVLAIGGTVLVGFPLVAPLVLAVGFLAAGQGLHVDYLMPGEFAAVAFGGAILLIVAAVLARRRVRLLVVAAIVAGVLFAVTTGIAAATGLASGATPAEGAPWIAVLTSFAGYVAALVALLVGGILLCRDVFRRDR